MKPQLVVALDLHDRAAARQAAAVLRGHADLVKVGLELFVSVGPEFVAELREEGWRVFLDLKCHDIPATVAAAVRAAAELGVEVLTLHAFGGARMIEAAASARNGSDMPRLLAVTVLTSLDDHELQRMGTGGNAAQMVEKLAGLAHDSGCDGVVASAQEVAAIKRRYGDAFVVATPGIRPKGASRDDQARVATVAEAVAAGADYLVVGRPILGAEDPAVAAAGIRSEMEAAHA